MHITERQTDPARIMRLNFAEDRDIEEAQAQANKLRLREQTERARLRGVLGAPTFFAGAEMFWGNDRFDDALDACLARSAAAT